MRVTRIIARRPGRNLADGITTAQLGRPDYARAMAQFEAYLAAVKACEVAVTLLDPLEGHPDAHFVEDTAVITPEVAVITRPGAAARRGEAHAMAAVLAAQRPVARIEAPGSVDGGDVLRVGRRLFIGLSERTNPAGAEQLARILTPFGYRCQTIAVAAGLHLKSSVNIVGPATLLTTPAFADHAAFGDFERIVVAADEAYAANTLLLNNHLLMPAGFAATRRRLEALAAPVVELEMSEFCKMDGGLTCLSLRL